MISFQMLATCISRLLLLLLLVAVSCVAGDNNAFTVELSTEQYLCTDQIIPFDKILYDSSDSFDVEFSAFRCPDDYYYSFYWTIAGLYDSVSAQLVMDGQDTKYGPLTDKIDSFRFKRI